MMLNDLVLKATLALLVSLAMLSSAVGAEKDFESLSGEQLVRLLVSPNAEPDGIRPGPKSRSKPPEGYDSKAQDIVYGAWNELLQRDESVIPALVEHCNDKRYSVTEKTVGDLTNLTVADACLRIMHAKLEFVRDVTRRPGYPSYVFHVIQANPTKWARSHANKSLAELQIEAGEWFLDQEINPSSFIPQEEVDKVRAHVQTVLREIKKSDKAVMPAPHKPIKRF